MRKHKAEIPESGMPAQAPGSQDHDNQKHHRRGLSPRASLIVRRLLALAIMLGIAYGIFHVIFRTDVLDPALAYVEPAADAIDWVMADQKRAWGALAAIVIPHIGLFYVLFEDRK